MKHPDLLKLRHEYQKAGLKDADILINPFDFFHKWLTEAVNAQVDEPNAMMLSTVNSNGYPSSRVVLLKGLESNSFVFYTNYGSRKGKHLSVNPNAAIAFYWKELERQVRIEGKIEKVSASESDEYFNSRPVESRISAIVSPQSEVIADRLYLDNLWDNWKKDNSDKTPLRPEHWGGYRLLPVYFEFWQGRVNRLHDRFRYCLFDGEWKINRLAP